MKFIPLRAVPSNMMVTVNSDYIQRLFRSGCETVIEFSGGSRFVVDNLPEDILHLINDDSNEEQRGAKPAATPEPNTVADVEGMQLTLTRVLGMCGAAYDPPGPHRAYTYEHQPANGVAWNLGCAVSALKQHYSGDAIDVGLYLLKEMQARGLGVFEIEPKVIEAASPQPNMRRLDWSNFDGPKRNVEWTPDDQDLIYTALNYRDDDYGDADEDVGQQLVERLLAAWKRTAEGSGE